MLQNIRENAQGTAAKIIVGLIVIAFAFFGIESILLSGGRSGVAEVNGEDISPMELQQAINTAKRRLISMLGDRLDPAMLDDERLRPQALEGLIARKLEVQSAAEMDLTVSEREIGATIASMEQFQADGNFSPELYKSLLSSAGFTPAYFKQSLGEDLVLSQVRSGLAGSDFATAAELELNAKIAAEQRDLRYLSIPLASFVSDEAVSAQEIGDYYANNADQFLTEESVELDYIELNATDFVQPVDESVLKAAYETEKQDHAYAAENRVSHILLEEREGESDEERQSRLKSVLSALEGGESFAEVARKHSDDIGSASSGGDLGFSSGDAFPEEMEEAIATLEVDEVSAPVDTDAGTHIIVVTERREGAVPTFEEMREQLESRIETEEARVVLLRTVESLRDIAFNAEDLQAPADELQLEVTQSEAITRDQREGLFANPALLEAAFSEDVLVNGHNSEVLELAGNHFVVLRVRRHNEPQVQPLEVVGEQIAGLLNDARAKKALQQEVVSIVQSLRGGASMEELATGKGYEWRVELGAGRNNSTVPAPVLQRAFEMTAPEEGQSEVDHVTEISGDAQVVQLIRVDAGDLESLPQIQRQRLQQQVSAEFAGLVDSEYRGALRDSADIKVM